MNDGHKIAIGRKGGLAATLLLGLAALGMGCTHARTVQAITMSRDQIKFLYSEGGTQGILKCQVAPDGSLSGCRQMTLALEQ
jgi:hypothetical protein